MRDDVHLNEFNTSKSLIQTILSDTMGEKTGEKVKECSGVIDKLNLWLFAGAGAVCSVQCAACQK